MMIVICFRPTTLSDSTTVSGDVCCWARVTPHTPHLSDAHQPGLLRGMFLLELLPLLPLPLVLEKEIRRFTRLVLYKERQLGEALVVLLKICLEHNYVPLPFGHPEPRLRGDANVLKHVDAGWHR